jgi:hypothetical protein
MVLVGLDIFFYFVTPGDQVAHLAHVGGAAFGYLFFRLQGLSRRSPHPPPRAVERVVMVQSGPPDAERRAPVTPVRPRRRPEADRGGGGGPGADKISEKGIASLTAAERCSSTRCHRRSRSTGDGGWRARGSSPTGYEPAEKIPRSPSILGRQTRVASDEACHTT